jgi:hypothetical protein
MWGVVYFLLFYFLIGGVTLGYYCELIKPRPTDPGSAFLVFFMWPLVYAMTVGVFIQRLLGE